jgi:hypothetical protein
MHLQAPSGFRRLAIGGALLLIALELGVFWFAARLTLLLQPPDETDFAALTAFIAFWSVLTLQAMVVAGFAWTMVALAWTTLDADDHVVVLAHPWRRWSGSWAEIAEGYIARDWLHLRARGHVRTWHVRVPRASHDTVAALQSRLPSDVWLTGSQARAVLLKRLLPPLLIGTAIGAGAILLLNQWIARVIESR